MDYSLVCTVDIIHQTRKRNENLSCDHETINKLLIKSNKIFR